MLYATGTQQLVLVCIPLKHCVRAFRSSRDLIQFFYKGDAYGSVLDLGLLKKNEERK
jgi:hypothetical protein